MSMMYQGHARQWEHHDSDQASATGWEQQELSIRWQLGQAGARQWWDQYQGLYAREFRIYMNSLIGELEESN